MMKKGKKIRLIKRRERLAIFIQLKSYSYRDYKAVDRIR